MRSKDRLAELRRLADGHASAGGVYQDTVEECGDDDRLKHIRDMFDEVERMRGWMLALHDNTQLMCRLHADPTFHHNKSLQEQLDAAATAANAAGLKVCGALRQFESRLSADNDARARIARLQYAAARRQLADVLAAHHAALDRLRDHRRALLARQLQLTNLAMSSEECEALLESGELALFVAEAGDAAEARRVLRDVEARHDELARLERALRDVRDLFTQLAHLVAQQQDQVDSVEYYALQATDHVGSGGTQLLKGTVSRTKARKKKVGLVVCLAAGLVVVLLVLVLT